MGTVWRGWVAVGGGRDGFWWWVGSADHPAATLHYIPTRTSPPHPPPHPHPTLQSDRWPAGHRATRSRQWAATDRPYTVEYEQVRMPRVGLNDLSALVVTGMMRCGGCHFVGGEVSCAVAAWGQDEAGGSGRRRVNDQEPMTMAL